MRQRRSRNVTTRRTVKKGPSALSWRFYLLSAVSFAVLVGGFLLSARNQFASMDYGVKNSGLRKQLDSLEAEKRRLLLSREVALSPTEIKRSARRLGLSEMTARNVDGYVSTEPKAVAKTAKPREENRVAGQIIASLNDSAPQKRASRTGLVSSVVGRSASSGTRN